MALIERVPELCGCHNVRLWPGREGYEVVLHCLADPDLSIEEAHRLADQVERLLRTHAPGVSRVLVHVEPEEG